MSSSGGRKAHRLSGTIGVTSRSSASATSTSVLSGEAQVVHFGRTRAHAYAARSVGGVERIRARRFCSINGSSTSPQLMHRKTVPPVEYSGRDSAIIKPLHFLQVMSPPPDEFPFVHTTANVAMED